MEPSSLSIQNLKLHAFIKIIGSQGQPTAEGTGYFFINKISKIQSFIVLRGLKCEKLANNMLADHSTVLFLNCNWLL